MPFQYKNILLACFVLEKSLHLRVNSTIMDMRPLFRTVLASTLAVVSLSGLRAGNLRMISSREGISNNSVLCLDQDAEGFIWLGTCEGLNFWDGQQMGCYPPEGSGMKPLSGNLIEKIHPTLDHYSWLRTNYGLDLMHRNRVIEQHKEFQGIYYLICRNRSETIVLTQGDAFYGYCEEDSTFRRIETLFPFESYIASWAGAGDEVYLFRTDGIFRTSFAERQPGQSCRLRAMECVQPMGLSYAFADQDQVLLIDERGYLYTFDPKNEVLEYIDDISGEIARYGKVSYAIRHGDDFLVSFLFDGVTKLRFTPENPRRYVTERLDINCGVFCLLKDAKQDVVWIGSDGQGLFMYANDELSFHSYTYDKLPYNLSKPVRSLLLDSTGKLWVATKGEGIVQIPDFSTARKPDEFVQINGRGSGLADHAVFALEESARGVVWIGSEGYGLNYQSLAGGPVRTLEGDLPPDLRYVHAIHESHRDTLWVATVGCGVFRLTLGQRGGQPYVRAWKKLDFGPNLENKTFFFTLVEDSDHTLWIGNRGGGLIHYFPDQDSCTVTSFSDSRAEIANDVWAIHRAADGRLWIGTSWGLLSLAADGQVSETPIRNIVHGILEDGDGKLYLSTNSGLVRYDPESQSHARYGYSYGINTIEYSDGAAWKDPATGQLFFGGTNGFVVVEQTRYRSEPFYPELLFRYVRINQRLIPFDDVVTRDSILVVRPRQRLYDVGVIALDYINGSNYTYLYNVEGMENRWLESSSVVQFAERHPGRYRLNVRYKNVVTGDLGPIRSLLVVIRAPWYTSVVAKILYALSFVFVTTVVSRYWYRRRQRQQAAALERIEAKRKEEILDSKLHLMENLAQQMAGPVFMISVPCQQMLDYAQSDDYIRRRSRRILRQGEKLSNIIHMLHNFRESSESGNNINVKIFSVTEYVTEIAKSYESLAREREIRFEMQLPEELLWTSDPKRVSSIVDMSMTNAFLHVARRGRIALRVAAEQEQLVIRLEVEGHWLDGEEFGRLTDRYDMMDDFQRSGERGESFQDEMRLVVCYNYVTGLGGTMHLENAEGHFTLQIALPSLSIASSEAESAGEFSEEYLPNSHILMIDKEKIRQFDTASDRPKMFIIGTDAGIINSIAEMFSEEYNIRTFRHADKFTEEMQAGYPDIILCENITMKEELSELMASVKRDRMTVKIPIILITSLQHADSLTDEYADSVLSLPINVKTLQFTVKQNLNRISSLREYYNSAVSVYEFSDGKMLHSDDRMFLEKLFKIIQENLSDSSMTTATIAERMGMSLRNLYHRLNGLVNVSPSNIIREYRLAYAEHLLTKTKLSVDEIIYKSGFTNRGTFFKNFSAKYGCTPRTYRSRKMEDLSESGELSGPEAADQSPAGSASAGSGADAPGEAAPSADAGADDPSRQS